MKVLIACETSGIIRDAFKAKGHDAMSCDLLETERPGNHYKGDVRDILFSGWADLMIAHPDCTYLTNSAAWAFGDGPYHQAVKPQTLVGLNRRIARGEAVEFVKLLMGAPIEKIAIENPVGSISTYIRPADQYIQPYEYGHDASKKTGLWLKALPKLKPTSIIQPRLVCCGISLSAQVGKFGCANCNGSKKPLPRWSNQTNSGQNKLSPGAMRWLERARTY